MNPESWSKHAPVYAENTRAVTLPYAELMNTMVSVLCSVSVAAPPAVSRSNVASEFPQVYGRAESPLRVLDIAAGPGAGSAALARLGRGSIHVISADYAPSMVEYARQTADLEGVGNLVDTEVADATSLHFDDGTFDVVVSNFGLFLVPDRAAALAEAMRVLKPGGILLYSSWTTDGLDDESARAFHPVLFRAMSAAAGREVKAPSIFSGPDVLREHALAIPNVDSVRIERFREGAVIRLSQLVTTTFDNPGMRGMFDKMSDEEASRFTEAFSASLISATGAKDIEEMWISESAAYISIIRKKQE